MVFKTINLARSVISKTFPNGYAQSLVAASQSSSASHNTQLSTLTGYFGKAGHRSSQPAYHGPTNTAGNAVSSRPDTTNAATERGLDAYYAAWQKHHLGEDKEWHQFQFAKRIGWKAPTTIPEKDTPAKSAAPSRPSPTTRASAPCVPHARSASFAEDVRPVLLSGSVNEDAAAAHDVASQVVSDAREELVGAQPSAVQADVDTAVGSPTLETTGVSTSTSSFTVSSPAPSTTATSIEDVDSYTNQLASLAEQHRHAETPAVFEALLRSGVQPTVTAYNSLLLAAINLPKGKHQVIPKVLDVYSDMLRRRVVPDTETYAILIEVLAARALDVSAMKTDLLQKQARYSTFGRFLFASDEAEFRILAEDDSLGLAITLFDTSAALTTNHAFPAETYSSLISACAEQARINDMVRIYAEMESQQITPPTAIFAPMIRAFAQTGDLRSAVECYDEYKALAIAHDQGLTTILRRDEDIYAALVKAYALCDQLNGGLKFLGKIEEAIPSADKLAAIRDTVALQALVPSWAAQSAYAKALGHVSSVTSSARGQALAAICIDAADKNDLAAASEALSIIARDHPGSALLTDAAASVLAANIRNRDLEAAGRVWPILAQSQPRVELIESVALYAVAHLSAAGVVAVLAEARETLLKIRNAAQGSLEIFERISEAIALISRRFLESAPMTSAAVSVELLLAMSQNDAVSNTLAEHLLAPLGPADVEPLSPSTICSLLEVQAGLLLARPQLDVGHLARLSHLIDLVSVRNIQLAPGALDLIAKATASVGRPDVLARLQCFTRSSATPTTPFSPAISVVSPAFEDTFDPYAAATDFKGSNMIAEELEKTYGRHAAHLSEALVKFKNIRRIGRHPRYATYAKLISAAAKENRMGMTQDILAMAKQDIPYLAHSRVVAQGWVTILDSMVAACLTMGKRELASQYHAELLHMGFAPSANTFGLYITTLKEGTKTFDEATEAVKIFHRAKREGVEPTSFLYNALIGKLGKARRIDDCLFYFAEMRQLGIRPTSVTYGTIVNALCRVSDDKFAEELFEEMESMPNYKPRPAPYNSLMQYFLTTKRDRTKVLAYYERMRVSNIEPTMHTYKLLMDTHATLEPVDMRAAEFVLAEIKLRGMQPEAVHYSALIHAKGCVMHDLPAARSTFDQVIAEGFVQPCASLYQAMFESMVANHDIAGTDALMAQMAEQNVKLTPYIANTLIHGWALFKNITKAKDVYEALGMQKREPSTYEAMTRAYLAVEDRANAKMVVGEALRRGYPAAVAGKICDLVGGA